MTIKKTSNTRKKHKGGRPQKTDIDTIFRYLYVLEQNDMKLSATAREIGVSKQMLWRWKDNYWAEYKSRKNSIAEQSETIAAVKLATVEHFAEIRGIMTGAMKLCLKRAIEILEDPKEVKKLKFYELTDFAKNIAPYTVDKVATMGAEDPNKANGNQPTFIQNIINEMNIRGINLKKDNKFKQIEDVKAEDQS